MDGKYKKVPVNVDDVYINPDTSKDKRIQSFVSQVKNPYLLKIDGVVVEMEYAAEGATMRDVVELACSF